MADNTQKPLETWTDEYKYQMRWTDEYAGVQHSGGPNNENRTWFTIENHTTFAKLLIWYPGCQFHPDERTYADVESAKKGAEEINKERNHVI